MYKLIVQRKLYTYIRRLCIWQRDNDNG